ncbi:hypothetical protein M427DRAFT_260047 [Gonapodya prolifera JEL478]|uniref:Uncharacterized protein n=1 Tax=Gonapodya prolifera (strain JEL478) TaxID=1344416 RepID=A0A139AKQ7_GONPJ|nr:hypothetical protein M427DRAFT_260047 [Gonapodya prolifera JEL478]|eukprot:KXS17357.1 hypothetical protein M427DRAFT_260047 [Gonapodya prolifera JEL478]
MQKLPHTKWRTARPGRKQVQLGTVGILLRIRPPRNSRQSRHHPLQPIPRDRPYHDILGSSRQPRHHPLQPIPRDRPYHGILGSSRRLLERRPKLHGACRRASAGRVYGEWILARNSSVPVFLVQGKKSVVEAMTVQSTFRIAFLLRTRNKLNIFKKYEGCDFEQSQISTHGSCSPPLRLLLHIPHSPISNQSFR